MELLDPRHLDGIVYPHLPASKQTIELLQRILTPIAFQLKKCKDTFDYESWVCNKFRSQELPWLGDMLVDDDPGQIIIDSIVELICQKLMRYSHVNIDEKNVATVTNEDLFHIIRTDNELRKLFDIGK